MVIDPNTDASDLNAPLGEPGSGRRRYAAAMALYQAGALPEGALEVYRICAARDAQNPEDVLREWGYVMTERATPGAQAALGTLVDEVDRYLGTLAGHGIAAVQDGIARWRNGMMDTGRGRGHPVVSQHLEAVLAPLRQTHATLARAIEAAVPFLDWLHFSDYPAEEIGEAFLAGNAYCIIIGERGLIRAEGFDLGLFLIAPHLLYRDHHHKAPELYAPLTGPHGWRFSPGGPLCLKPAHEPVWNEPDAPHLTKVGPVPFLCIYGWTRDVNDPPQVIPADDWAALEALRLE